MKSPRLPLLMLALALALTLSPKLYAQDAGSASESERPVIEVAFVLDTTGSMGGLLDGAKQKIWAIVNELAGAEPSPDIRIALVGYRDIDDEYVTRVHGLTDDLDRVFIDLSAFVAGGGGDGPEHVNRALWVATHELDWSTDARTLRVMFLVGDAPPHTDYAQDVQYADTLQEAVRKDIRVNTIRCGEWAETGRIFAEIARLGEGSYLSVDASGGTVAIDTPYDADLAALSDRLSGTYIGYGSEEERRDAESGLAEADAVAGSAPAEARAERAMFRARGDGLGHNDLIALFESSPEKLAEFEGEALPEELRELSLEELTRWLTERLAERKAIQDEIAALASERQGYIREQLEANGNRDAFDTAVLDMLREQAAEKGIELAD